MLTVPQIAEQLNLSTRTVVRFIEQGKLKAYRFGKDYRIKEEDFEEFIKNSQIN